MKKLILTLGMLLLTASVFAADPTLEAKAIQIGSQTIDSTHDTGSWEVIDSLVFTITDTSHTVLAISGIAVLDPGDVIRLGFGNDSANRVDSATGATTGSANSNLDSCFISLPKWQRGKAYIPFSYRFAYNYNNQTDVTDTFYVNGTIGGSTQIEKVTLTNMTLTGNVINYDTTFVP